MVVAYQHPGNSLNMDLGEGESEDKVDFFLGMINLRIIFLGEDKFEDNFFWEDKFEDNFFGEDKLEDKF